VVRKWQGVVVGMAAVVVVGAAAPANAAGPPASCIGQELSALGPALGADLGAVVSFEARNPELEGRRSFGEEVSSSALSDPTACPEE
jgi:hypothetical protein